MTRGLTKAVALATVLLAGLVLAAGPVSAQYSPNEITTNVTVVAPGENFTVTGCCFDPDSKVDASFHSTPIPLGALTADSVGKVSGSFTVPDGVEPGAHKVVLSGMANGVALTLSADLQVDVAGTTAAAGSLPVTGSNNTGPYTAIGAGLIVAGGALVLIVRRRREDQLVTN